MDKSQTGIGAANAAALTGKSIFVAGHTGMAGAAIVRRLARERCRIVTIPRAQLDLTRQSDVDSFLKATRPDIVVVAAARVGGIKANMDYPVAFLADNLAIANNLVTSSHAAGVKKLLMLGSTCVYPRDAAQPMDEEQFLTGPFEPTNEWYALAKAAAIKLCQAFRREYGDDFISVMPTNLYGPGDNYHSEQSHVVAALIRRFHEGKARGADQVPVWGTGAPRREFMYVDDLADACAFILSRSSEYDLINIGVGEDISIADFAALIAKIVGYSGRIVFDPSRPDGMPRKLVDVSRLDAMGWRAKTPLEDGLRLAYADFLTGGGRNRDA
jgi:GDP-L-fucose synthase